MCVICISPRGTKQPDEGMIRAMFAANHHGAGYMFARSGVLNIRKGFLTVGDLLDAAAADRLTAQTPTVWHFRIATSGGVSQTMTQPFPVLYNNEENFFHVSRCRLGVAHNGVLANIPAHYLDKMSDTAFFAQYILSGVVKNLGTLSNPSFRFLLGPWLNGSRLAFMDAAGNYSTLGKFWADPEGRLFSNTLWKSLWGV